MDDEESLDCPVCMEEYDEGLHTPKMTQCLHTFCVSCVTDLVCGPSGREEGHGTSHGTDETQVPRGKGLMCPLCREMINTDRMQTNRYVLAHLRDLVRLKAVHKGETQRPLPQPPLTPGPLTPEPLTPGPLTHQQQKHEQRQQKLLRKEEHRQQKEEHRQQKQEHRQQKEEYRQQKQRQKELIRQHRVQQKERLRQLRKEEFQQIRKKPPPPPPTPPPCPPTQPPRYHTRLVILRSPKNPAPQKPSQPGQLTHAPGRLYPNLFDTSPSCGSEVLCHTSAVPPSAVGGRGAGGLPPAGVEENSVSVQPSAPPLVGCLVDMWCRTCEVPARATCTAHHLTPLLKGEEFEWIEQQQQQERSKIQQEKQRQQEQQQQQEAEQRQEEHRRQQQEEKDLKLALMLAGVTIQDFNNSQVLTSHTDRCAGDLGGAGSGGAESALDLSHWTYAQIRDVINTSCEPLLLQACHKEFDRRRQEYHRTIRRRGGKSRRAPLIP
ncbi:histone-lysine N-methyltransferase 2D isoform X1 [Procambarus clarkii]|uniref:histone-lysine N-methyltransferase 2D isoform X1 n=1 Tax=Procambarus clarkii TaxID=6728 RepID=UPI003743F1D1